MKGSPASRVRAKAAKSEHPLQWLAEPLLAEPTFELRSWFGGRTLMLDGKHQLFLTTQGEPWQGVLVCTFHEHQESLRADFPTLRPHPILGKWLYLSESADNFESIARQLVQRVRARDPRLGVPPSPRKSRKTKRIRFGDSL